VIRCHIQRVLPASDDSVCSLCLGGKDSAFVICDGCDHLRSYYHIPRALWTSFVTITTAVAGQAWSTRLATYKDGSRRYFSQVAAVTRGYLNTHGGDVARALGGPPDALVALPSKQGGGSWSEQPLVALADVARPLGLGPRNALVYRGGAAPRRRRSYYPENYEPGPDPVGGMRVIVLADTWVTGGSLLSAAGALLEHGATAVLPVAIARHADRGHWEARVARSGPHPYWSGIQGPWEMAHWPRPRGVRPAGAA
jgi:hypothetical protein